MEDKHVEETKEETQIKTPEEIEKEQKSAREHKKKVLKTKQVKDRRKRQKLEKGKLKDLLH